MTSNDNQPYIYIRSTRERIPCTKEEFDNYYHDITLSRQREQYLSVREESGWTATWIV